MGDSSDLGKGILSVATGGGSLAADEAFVAPQRRGARETRRAQDKSFEAENKARETSLAQSENERRAAVKQQVRQERVRRAQVISAAESAGVTGSSVEASTIGAGQTITAMGQAFASGATLSNVTTTNLLQDAAKFRLEGAQATQRHLVRGQAFKTAFDLGLKAFSAGGGGA